MTLKETILALEKVAAQQPAINQIVRNDVFRLNSLPDVLYGVFAWTQREHTMEPDSDTVNFAFTLFYVDRLTEDHSNEVDVQSMGVQVLTNIIRGVEDAGVWPLSSYSFTSFNQRFTDECAGVYCNITLQVPVSSLCGDVFGNRTVVI